MAANQHIADALEAVAELRQSADDVIETIGLIAFRVQEALPADDPTEATWLDMFRALQDILEIIRESKGGAEC